MKILVTGGAGFIGSALVRMACARGFEVVVLDKLTYAGNLENLESVEGQPGYRFVRGDIRDAALVESLIADERPGAILHLAAESHVDRSILAPGAFVETNVLGTFTLLEAARKARIGRFVQVSTDEVYGSIEAPASADEGYPLQPNSPYSASKAAADLLVRSYWKTYGLAAIVTRASNNYGPHQFPEKLMPLTILNAFEGKELPVYGDGRQVRDWLYVDDHARALLAVLERGRAGEIYNIGGSEALENLAVVRAVLEATGRPESLIRHIEDRPGHDRRYSLSSDKIFHETGWRPEVSFITGLPLTIQWYERHPGWIERVRTQEYLQYYAANYSGRGLGE